MIEEKDAVLTIPGAADTPSNPQERDRGDYSKARFMALHSRPVSVEAQALVEEVTARIESWEQGAGTRRYQRRGEKRAQFRRAIGLVLGDLALAADKDADRWTYRPLARGEFTNAPVSFRQFSSVLKGLTAARLVEVLLGYYDRTPGFVRGKSTRLRASDSLIVLLREHGIGPTRTTDHFLTGLPLHPLVLKSSSTRKGHLKESGRRIGFEHTDHTRRLEGDIRELNDFIDSHEILGGTHRGYQRIFNCGDRKDYSWNKGGRLYSQGEDSYQRRKKAQRPEMTIDGETVVEIDIRASYLTILHARCGVPLDASRDTYAVDGLPRDVVKAWVTMTLGHDKFHTRWPKEKVEDFAKEGVDLRDDFPLKLVQPLVLQALPILADWPDKEIDCFDLMYLESEAVVNTMLRLKREHGVVCLSVHDSIIVPRSHLDLAKGTLVHEYERVVGVKPAVKVNEAE
jgi:hypothetical protein